MSVKTEIAPQPGIMEIKPYSGGLSRIDGMRNAIKLSSNENPFGPGEAARRAFVKSAENLHRYPPSGHEALRRAIGEVHGVDPERVVCGAGSDEIIAFLCQAYAGPGDEVIHTEHGFAMYRISALANGANPVEVPERERVTSPKAILAACTEKTRLVFLANPNNPTGTMISREEMSKLAASLPDRALLVIDGAYAEYLEGYDGGAALVDEFENVVMTRTFSKLYGLGGLRVGWGYGPPAVVETLNRIRGPFNLGGAALAAAKAAVQDADWVRHCREQNTRLRDSLAEALATHGVPSDKSFANFILARFSSRAEAEECDGFLLSNGIIVRKVAGYKLPDCLRITIGDETACHLVANAVGRFMGGGH
ncbi:MAG: histidinol-phosphate transaminase [Roseovarius sp.]|nr:histidinol-phosphate transaminase [Roseovarius sp.]